MLKSTADQNPPTLNPGTIELARRMIRPLITKVKRPSVSRLIGSVRTSRSGLMNMFKSARITAVASAGKNETLDPGTSSAVIIMAKADTMRRSMGIEMRLFL